MYQNNMKRRSRSPSAERCQNIVMEDEAAARAAIAYLKKKQAGRATFLPLDVMRGRYIPEQELHMIQKMPGYIGIAVDLVTYVERYDHIAANLLGNAVIAETLEHANQLAGRLNTAIGSSPSAATLSTPAAR